MKSSPISLYIDSELGYLLIDYGVVTNLACKSQVRLF
jgi:hypothetical protein